MNRYASMDDIRSAEERTQGLLTTFKRTVLPYKQKFDTAIAEKEKLQTENNELKHKFHTLKLQFDHASLQLDQKGGWARVSNSLVYTFFFFGESGGLSARTCLDDIIMMSNGGIHQYWINMLKNRWKLEKTRRFRRSENYFRSLTNILASMYTASFIDYRENVELIWKQFSLLSSIWSFSHCCSLISSLPAHLVHRLAIPNFE